MQTFRPHPPSSLRHTSPDNAQTQRSVLTGSWRWGSGTSFSAYLCQDGVTQLHGFSFLRLKTDNLVVNLLAVNDSVDVVKQAEQMSLRGEGDMASTRGRERQNTGAALASHVTWMVCESEAWPRISSRAGSDTKKKRGKTRRFFSR